MHQLNFGLSPTNTPKQRAPQTHKW